MSGDIRLNKDDVEAVTPSVGRCQGCGAYLDLAPGTPSGEGHQLWDADGVPRYCGPVDLLPTEAAPAPCARCAAVEDVLRRVETLAESLYESAARDVEEGWEAMELIHRARAETHEEIASLLHAALAPPDGARGTK